MSNAKAYVIVFQGRMLGNLISWGVYPSFPVQTKLDQRLLFAQEAKDYASAVQLAHSKLAIDLRYEFVRDLRLRCRTPAPLDPFAEWLFTGQKLPLIDCTERKLAAIRLSTIDARRDSYCVLPRGLTLGK